MQWFFLITQQIGTLTVANQQMIVDLLYIIGLTNISGFTE